MHVILFGPFSASPFLCMVRLDTLADHTHYVHVHVHVHVHDMYIPMSSIQGHTGSREARQKLGTPQKELTPRPATIIHVHVLPQVESGLQSQLVHSEAERRRLTGQLAALETTLREERDAHGRDKESLM